MKRREMNNQFIFFYNSFDVLTHVTRGPTTLGPAEEDKDWQQVLPNTPKNGLGHAFKMVSPMLT